MDTNDLLPVTLIDEDENFIIKLNHYWPHGLRTNITELNENLLYLFSHKIPSAYTLCTCKLNRFEYQELKKMYEYEFDYGKFEVYEENDLKSIAKSNRKPVQIVKFLEFPCCHFRLYHEVVDLYLCKMVRFFYQKKRISFYLNLEELKESKTIPASLLNDLNGKFSSLFRNGQIGKIQKKFKPGDTINYGQADMGSFSLKLEDYQLRTINWMKAVELNIQLEKGSIQCRNDNSNQNLPNVKIQFGDLNFYVGLNGPFMLSRTPKTAKPYKAPVNGGFLAELPGVDSQGTVLGMLFSCSSDANCSSAGISAVCIDQKNYFTSNANVVVCTDQNKWIEPLSSNFPNSKIIYYKLAEYSWKDIIEADVILCTYDQLEIIDLMKKFDWKGEEIILNEKGRANLFHCKYRRIFFDSINEDIMPLFKTLKKLKKVLESDFKWGILEDCDELSSSLMDYFGFSGSLIDDPFTHNQFINKFVRRHDITHLLPEIIDETLLISVTTREKMILSRMKTRRNFHGENYKQTVLDHFILAKNDENLSVKDLKQIQKEICCKTMKEILALEREIEKMNLNSSEISGKLEKLANLRSFQKFGEETFTSLSEGGNRRTCPICYDEIKDENFGILKCCHIFCYECVAWHVGNYGKCPLCSKETDSVTPFTLEVKENLRIEEVSGLKIVDYGSKLINVFLYISELIQEDLNARIVVYIQYRSLEDYFHVFLQKMGIEHLRIFGNGQEVEFQKGHPKIALICKDLRPKHLNLTAATHILLLHPFEDFKTELQGIRFAHRWGLKHPLKVVRFVVEGTIEEEQFKANEKSK